MYAGNLLEGCAILLLTGFQAWPSVSAWMNGAVAWIAIVLLITALILLLTAGYPVMKRLFSSLYGT